MLNDKMFVSKLKIWSGPVTPIPLSGGITNVNFVVEDAGQKFVVRVGNDIPLHQVMRFNELAASKAGYKAGLSPEVIHHEVGALVIRYIDGKTFEECDVQNQENLERILPVIQRCHHDMPTFLRGPALVFWVFHILRDYAATIHAGESPHHDKLAQFMEQSEKLEKAVGPVDLVYGHNDLLPANFIDDGSKVWLIDWDYGGFNSSLFDLGGLASNCGLTVKQEEWLLEAYFDRPVTDYLRHRYQAMKCASLLRETMWSMVSELHSTIDFNFSDYTRQNLALYHTALSAFNEK